MNKAFVACVICAMLQLTGCGPPTWAVRANDHVKSGRCDDARQEIERGGGNIEARAMMMAGVYHDCDRNRAQAIKWATLAARYGNEPAVGWLTQLGEPVPSPDLKQTSRGISLTDALLIGAAQGLQEREARQKTPAIVNTNCFKTGNAVSCTSF